LSNYFLFYATEGEFLMELRRYKEAAVCIRTAVGLAPLQAEKQLLQKKLDECLKFWFEVFGCFLGQRVGNRSSIRRFFEEHVPFLNPRVSLPVIFFFIFNFIAMQEYLLLIRTEGNPGKCFHPSSNSCMYKKRRPISEILSKEGKLKSAQPLELEGKIVSNKKGEWKDGPFNESKEVIAGYFLIVARTWRRR